jgi:hypothetical protein
MYLGMDGELGRLQEGVVGEREGTEHDCAGWNKAA